MRAFVRAVLSCGAVVRFCGAIVWCRHVVSCCFFGTVVSCVCCRAFLLCRPAVLASFCAVALCGAVVSLRAVALFRAVVSFRAVVLCCAVVIPAVLGAAAHCCLDMYGCQKWPFLWPFLLKKYARLPTFHLCFPLLMKAKLAKLGCLLLPSNPNFGIPSYNLGLFLCPQRHLLLEWGSGPCNPGIMSPHL